MEVSSRSQDFREGIAALGAPDLEDGIIDALLLTAADQVGERFTAADLTVASLLAPVLVPESYGAKLPPLDALPSELRAVVEETRATRTGAQVMRVYAEERGARVGPDPRE